jgi:hypothetical protein
MSADKESSALYEAISRVCDGYAERKGIHPAWLATETMVAIGFPHDLHPLGYLGCHLQLRQMARQFCRKKFDPAEATEDDLFEGTLQPRYPRHSANAEDEPEYILLDFLTSDDVDFNVARLRKEARAKLKHADALEAFGQQKFQYGAA